MTCSQSQIPWEAVHGLYSSPGQTGSLQCCTRLLKLWRFSENRNPHGHSFAYLVQAPSAHNLLCGHFYAAIVCTHFCLIAIISSPVDKMWHKRNELFLYMATPLQDTDVGVVGVLSIFTFSPLIFLFCNFVLIWLELKSSLCLTAQNLQLNTGDRWVQLSFQNMIIHFYNIKLN